MSIMSSPSGDLSRVVRSASASSGRGSDSVVGADEHAGNRALHMHGRGGRKQSHQRLQAPAIGERLARQRVQRADLGLRSVHPRDVGGDAAHVVGIGQRPVAQVDLRQPHVVLVGAGERTQGARMTVRAAEAGEQRRGGHVGRLRLRGPRAVQPASQRSILVERARQVDLRRRHLPGGDPLAEHPQHLGPLFGGREPSQLARQPQHARAHGSVVRVARELEIAVARRRIASDLVQRQRHGRRPALRLAQGRRVPLDAIEEQADFRHVATQQLMQETDLLRR